MKPIIDSPGFNAVVKGRYGYMLYNKNDIYVGKSIEKYGECSEAEAALLRTLCVEGDIVVEVGANIGSLSLPIAQRLGKTGRLHVFEPQRIVFQTLCANMALNSIENVDCYQIAAAGKNGTVHLPDIRYDVAGNFGGVSGQNISSGYPVRAVRLDDFLDLTSLKMIKIDVEGMEQDVINGAKGLIAKHKPLLYVENDRKEKSKQLIELIRSLDYRMFWHLPPLFNPDNFAGCSEDIFPNIVSVNMLCFHKSINLHVEGSREVLDPDFHPIWNK